ncbi:hypothetical protein HOC37_02755 [bacterium]|jgi:parvulin-like peptidyl-prolyl isomerase|nr:hypothetical protein [bacterium]MBT3581547.1 hypothetical protein [bacterium]MBT4551888.1 hypothetical protein [bacterium]MBT5988395.1 hypothetical protein [bacterium]MBT7087494.1 hypothetical protein [bacterium]
MTVKKIMFLMILAIFLCGFWSPETKQEPIAWLDDQPIITLQELNERTQQLQEKLQTKIENKDAKVKILNQMLDEHLIYNEAVSKGYEQNSAYKKQLISLKKQLLLSLFLKDTIEQKIKIKDQELETYYQENPDQFRAKELRRIRHIVVQDKASAETILKKIKKGADFASLAQTYSQDTGSAANGGEIGWVSKGQLVPSLENAVYNLSAPTKISPMVQTSFGYHIIQLIDIEKVPALTYAQAKDKIYQLLFLQKKEKLLKQSLDKLKQKHKIKKDISNIK